MRRAALLLAFLPFGVCAKDNPAAPPAFDEAAALAELRKSIAGKEETPSKDVFKDVRLLGNMPAGRLLSIMERGYSRSLGVTCTHCHVAGAWESDQKPEKGIAREMITMARAITEQHLKKIPNIKSAQPFVNCSTCHKGQARPGADRQAPPTGTPPGAPPQK